MSELPAAKIVLSTSAAQVTSIAIHIALLGLRRRHLPPSHGSSSTSAASKTARSLPRRRTLNIVACLQKARPLAKHQGDPTLLHPLPTPSQLLHHQQDSPQRQPILSVQQDERCLFHQNAHIWIFLNNLLTVCCGCCSACAFSQSRMWLQQ